MEIRRIKQSRTVRRHYLLSPRLVNAAGYFNEGPSGGRCQEQDATERREAVRLPARRPFFLFLLENTLFYQSQLKIKIRSRFNTKRGRYSDMRISHMVPAGHSIRGKTTPSQF